MKLTIRIVAAAAAAVYLRRSCLAVRASYGVGVAVGTWKERHRRRR